jgi:hypothetical protein
MNASARRALQAVCDAVEANDDSAAGVLALRAAVDAFMELVQWELSTFEYHLLQVGTTAVDDEAYERFYNLAADPYDMSPLQRIALCMLAEKV